MLPYVVRERRFDPRSYLPLVVGAVIVLYAITDGDLLLAVLGLYLAVSALWLSAS